MITRSKIGILIGHRQIGKQKTGSSQSFSSTAGSADKPVCWKAGLLAGRAVGSCGHVLPFGGCVCSLKKLQLQTHHLKAPTCRLFVMGLFSARFQPFILFFL